MVQLGEEEAAATPEEASQLLTRLHQGEIITCTQAALMYGHCHIVHACPAGGQWVTFIDLSIYVVHNSYASMAKADFIFF